MSAENIRCSLTVLLEKNTDLAKGTGFISTKDLQLT